VVCSFGCGIKILRIVKKKKEEKKKKKKKEARGNPS